MSEFSVIIPVYKVEPYLRQCVDSVISQHVRDLEVILVDDGSPDGCPQICDEYQAKYDFVKVIHKKNGGLSSARNAGIEAASGSYLMFMDSDDWWNPEVDVNTMLNTVKQHPETEMFLFSSLDYIEGTGYFKRKEHERLSGIRTDSVAHYYADLLANGNLEISAATKIFRKNFIIRNQLFFREGIVCEDSEWIMRVLRVLKNVYIINQPLYVCRLGRRNSITNTVGKRNLHDMLNIIQWSMDHYKGNPCGESMMQYEFCYCAYLWFCALGLSNSLKAGDFAEICLQLKKTASVCRYSNSPKTKASYFVYRIFGLRIARFVLGQYLAVKHRFNINKKQQAPA